jgi:uncharacterized membrane protein (DUF2068 family)
VFRRGANDPCAQERDCDFGAAAFAILLLVLRPLRVHRSEPAAMMADVACALAAVVLLAVAALRSAEGMPLWQLILACGIWWAVIEMWIRYVLAACRGRPR